VPARVAFILSTNYAGSHYLSLLIGSHSRALHLGEVKRLRHAERAKPTCSVCGDACKLFEGIGTGALPGADLYERLLRNAGPGIELLVDNSKHLRWVRHFLRPGGLEPKFIHLLRDPRALIRRWAINYEAVGRGWKLRYRMLRRRPDLGLPGAFLPVRRFLLYRWLELNTSISALIARHGLDARVLTYRDLATDPARELGELMPWLGLPFEPAQLEYWNFPHHGSQKREYEWVKDAKVQFVDRRWQEFLTDREQAWVLGHPRLARYLERLGIGFTDDGLTRYAARPEVVRP
jgi:hypothetical protein